MRGNNGDKEEVMHHVKDYFCETALAEGEYERVHKAMESITKMKQGDPRRVMALFMNEGNEPEIVAQSVICSNLPLMVIFKPDGEMEEEFLDASKMLGLLSDKGKLISEMSENIVSIWGRDSWIAWEVMEFEYETSTEIYLSVDPSESDEAVRLMEGFNRDVLPIGYKALAFDSETSMITGNLAPKWEGHGFFKKRQIRKENKWYDERFNQFIDDLNPYLRRFR